MHFSIIMSGTKMMIVGSKSPNCENVESMRFPTGASCSPEQIKINVQTFVTETFPNSAVESLGKNSFTLTNDRYCNLRLT